MNTTVRDPAFIRNMLESSISIGLLFIILIWSFNIIAPFVLPIIWGAILAVALMPVARKLGQRLGGRNKLAINLIVLFGVLILVIPSYVLVDSAINSMRSLAQAFQQGSLNIPSPSDRITSLPVVGQQIASFWTLLETNLEVALERIRPELVEVGHWLAGRAAGLIKTVLIFAVSIVIAGAFMQRSSSMVSATKKFATRVAGDKGAEWADLAANTITSVIAGVLGVAVIQAFLLAIGMFLLDVPGAGILTVVALFFAIVQVPNLILMIPVIAYVYSTHDTTPATIFSVWSLFSATSNLWLGPMLMGRGVNVPMLIVFLGAIGGMMFQGIIGLFVGAVVLALVYSLYEVWLNEDEPDEVLEASTPQPPA